MKQPNNDKHQQTAKSDPGSSSAANSPASAQRALKEIGSEPIARRAAAPALLFAILAAFLYWGDTHILGHGGDLDAHVYYPFVSSNEVAGFNIREPEDPRFPQGRAVFGLVCKACHQEDGLGGVAQGCPPLAGSDWVLSEDPSRIIAIVVKGLTGPINVSGKEYGTGTMLGLQNLSNEEIAGVLSVIRNHWNNKAPMVDAAQVQKIRDEVKDHSGYMTVEELKKRYPKAGPG